MKKPTHERGFLVSCLLAQSVWLAVSAVLLLIFCAIAVSAEDPARLITPLSLCALYLGASSAGIAAVKLSGDGILSGLVSGVISAILTLSLSYVPFPASSVELPMKAVFMLLILPTGVIGSLIGKKRNSAVKSLKKMHR